jgi:hypothetical protein
MVFRIGSNCEKMKILSGRSEPLDFFLCSSSIRLHR